MGGICGLSQDRYAAFGGTLSAASVMTENSFCAGLTPKQTELSSVLLLAPASTRPSPETLKKIGQITLMLEAAGGETLDGFLSGAMEMTQL